MTEMLKKGINIWFLEIITKAPSKYLGCLYLNQ